MERELDMQVGMLSYHRRVLVESGMLRSEPEGNHLRYFTSEGFILTDRKVLGYLRNPSTRAILMHAIDRGPISFIDLQSLTGLSKSTLSYHLKRLSGAGLVSLSRGNRVTVKVADPEKVINLLVWVREEVEGDAAGTLIDVWNRLTEK